MANPLSPSSVSKLRHDWEKTEIEALFKLPFTELCYQAQQAHRQFFPDAKIQVSTLLSIKTGACPENCKYCPQSAHYKTFIEKESLLEVKEVEKAAQEAKKAGASRFCMGAAWRQLHDRDLPRMTAMIQAVKAQGLESCMTLGMLTSSQAEALKCAGLDYYNHNIDTSPEYYSEVITTRTFNERLQTLEYVRNAGMKVCCGGIIGLGETIADRVSMLQTLANLPEHPESVPINLLVRIEGTPLAQEAPVDIFDFVRTIAVTRIVMPASWVRLSAGREAMNDEAQALCFIAGANSIFYGEKLLTTANPAIVRDQALLGRLGIEMVA